MLYISPPWPRPHNRKLKPGRKNLRKNTREKTRDFSQKPATRDKTPDPRQLAYLFYNANSLIGAYKYRSNSNEGRSEAYLWFSQGRGEGGQGGGGQNTWGPDWFGGDEILIKHQAIVLLSRGLGARYA